MSGGGEAVVSKRSVKHLLQNSNFGLSPFSLEKEAKHSILAEIVLLHFESADGRMGQAIADILGGEKANERKLFWDGTKARNTHYLDHSIWGFILEQFQMPIYTLRRFINNLLKNISVNQKD